APDAATARRAVLAGEADALALSAPAVRWMAKPGETEIAEPFEEAARDRLGFGGFVFRKGDLRLREAWNARLQALVGSPEHLALIARFGFTRADLPGRVSTESLVEEP
ncbi:MAG: ABC transporter substrate-binding protein, partial [Acidobacteria bacterium]|nr:ABC transporter substrate-binding protein [Acidobacteriota bacterium]